MKIEYIKIIVEIIGVSSILVVFIEFFLNKRLKSFNNSLNKLLENHKNELNIILHKANRLNEKRLETISILYSKLVVLDDSISSMIFPVRIIGENEIDYINNSNKAFCDFAQYFRKNEILFSKTTITLINNLITKYKDIYNNYTHYREMNPSDPDERIEKREAHKEFNQINSEVPNVLEKLKEEFRNLIGVDK